MPIPGAFSLISVDLTSDPKDYLLPFSNPVSGITAEMRAGRELIFSSSVALTQLRNPPDTLKHDPVCFCSSHLAQVT